MKNALGRWSAQYQQEAPVSLFTGGTILEETAGHNGAHVATEFVSECDPEFEPAAPEPQSNPEESASQAATAALHDNAGSRDAGPAGTGQPRESQQGAAGANESSAQEPSGGDRQQEQRGEAFSDSKERNIIDYYEVLQISRNADPETIHRVYRIMVARFHPDNPRTGNADRFQLLRRAYHVLSDPGRRAEYDRTFTWAETHTLPIFEMKEFVDGVDGEKNRRLGILSLLYHRRRISEQQPGVSVLDLEHRMGFPREYLNFTLWYLKSKGYVRFEDNSDYGVTVEGVDYLEANSGQNTIIRELLEAGNKGETCTSACGTSN